MPRAIAARDRLSRVRCSATSSARGRRSSMPQDPSPRAEDRIVPRHLSDSCRRPVVVSRRWGQPAASLCNPLNGFPSGPGSIGEVRAMAWLFLLVLDAGEYQVRCRACLWSSPRCPDLPAARARGSVTSARSSGGRRADLASATTRRPSARCAADGLCAAGFLRHRGAGAAEAVRAATAVPARPKPGRGVERCQMPPRPGPSTGKQASRGSRGSITRCSALPCMWEEVVASREPAGRVAAPDRKTPESS
jgi:hypothetical protein